MGITSNKLTFIIILIGLLVTVTAYLVKTNPAPSGSEISGNTKANSTSADTISPDKPEVSPGRWPIFRADQGLRGVAGGSLTDNLSLYWSFKTESEIKSSAVIGNGLVFCGSDDGHVYAVEQKTGRKAWSFQAGDAVEASPCLVDDMVVVGSFDSFLYALDAKTGKLKWKYQTAGEIPGSANWFRAGGKDAIWILIGSYDNKLHCINAATGRVVWTYKSDNYINGTPAVISIEFVPRVETLNRGQIGPATEMVIFGGCDAKLHIISAIDGKLIRQIDCGAYIAGSAALANGLAFVGNYEDSFICADINRGNIVWRYHNKGDPFYSSPAVGEKRVVVGGRDKLLYCFDREDGELLWTFAAKGGIDSSPVICDSKVIVGSDDGQLYMVTLSAGKPIWSFDIGQAITASPAVAGGMVFVGSEDGNLYAFGP